MNDLLEKYNDYMRLNGCRAEYILVNGIKIEFFYKEQNFIHLLGLHKLKDIQMIQLFNDKKNRVVQTQYVISRIKQEKFTDTMVRASSFFSEIADRYETFTYDNLSTITYTDAVVDFDPSRISSKLKSDYLLFEEKGQGEYNHLGIALDPVNGKRYIETFFHQSSANYITGQKVIRVSGFTLYNPENQIIVRDYF